MHDLTEIHTRFYLFFKLNEKLIVRYDKWVNVNMMSKTIRSSVEF